MSVGVAQKDRKGGYEVIGRDGRERDGLSMELPRPASIHRRPAAGTRCRRVTRNWEEADAMTQVRILAARNDENFKINGPRRDVGKTSCSSSGRLFPRTTVLVRKLKKR